MADDHQTPPLATFAADGGGASEEVVLASSDTTGTQSPMQQPEQEQLRSSDKLHVPVEAFGSGVVLHDGLSVPLDATVADLRQLVLSSTAGPLRTRTLRLFVGHGGSELTHDAMPIAESELATELDEPEPLVVFRTLCTSSSRDFCRGTRDPPSMATLVVFAHVVVLLWCSDDTSGGGVGLCCRARQGDFKRMRVALPRHRCACW
mgnify:FL=1